MTDIKKTAKITTKTPATKSSKNPPAKKTNLAASTPQKVAPPQQIAPPDQMTQTMRSENIKQLQEIVRRAHDIISIYMDSLKVSHFKKAISTPNGALLTASKSILKLAVDVVRSPGVMTKTNIKYALGVSKIISTNFLGKVTPTPFEKRFKSKAWSDNTNYNTLKEVYLYTCDTIMETIRTVSRADPHSRTVTEFYIQRLTDMFSPSNFPLTNPDVVATTIEEKGANILRGLNNFLDDLERGKGALDISMVDTSKYQIGENIAATPGVVIYRNDFIELLHYHPQKESIAATPLLIVPPWINKYYILDLQQKNSFVKWLLDQGQNVFLISWYNPGAEQAHWDFEDYMSEGVLAALCVVRDVAASEKVNMIGYCIGGTLLSATLAYLKATDQDVVASATFMTTLIDFNQGGELKIFLDETQIKLLEKRTRRIGYMEKKAFTNVFNLLRANDLIWSFIVNNYYLGKQPPAFDILYWNIDSTRMTSTLQSFYLRNMYLYNLLTIPGGVTLKGVPIDLGCIDIPVIFIASKDDHIAPWKGVYDGVKLFKSSKSFILSGSGHVAGMINPPSDHKYHYWINNETPDTAEEWLKSAQQHMGSWWPTWKQWLGQNHHNKTKMPAPKTLTHPKYPALEKAPGQYVKIV